jgi:asparagine synthase (glutamine-hydrolysing)
MCGIAGCVTGGKVEASLIKDMCDAVHHRGPDDEGYHVTENVGLGMRRLAIIDVASGRQPIYNEDRTIVVVYNGETYNFEELRRTLQRKGHLFRTDTDTECIVHLYEEYGERCVEHMRGMFAFALWDDRRKRLLLARDRIGKKPLFYRMTGEGIWFASEVKSLLVDPTFERRVDPVALHHYLTYQYVPAPWSIFEGLRKLPPAHTLVYEHGQATLRRYWRLSYREKLRVSEEEATQLVEESLREAVRLRLISERPLGAFLSGGVDSSLVVSMMAEMTSVKTFTIGFDEAQWDERRFARQVAERYSTEHHELVVRPSITDLLWRMARHYDEPFADSSAVPSFCLAELAAAKVTVALNGDGADESFGGYLRYTLFERTRRLRVPDLVQPLLASALTALPRSALARALLAPAVERYPRMMSYFDSEQKRALYTDGFSDIVGAENSYDLITDLFETSDAEHVFDQLLDVDVQTYLPGDLLVKMDIATMAHSLEARSPFLDHRLMELAASLDVGLKRRAGKGKHILRVLGARRLPRAVLERPKMGFGVPIGRWLRNELRDMTWDLLTDPIAEGRGYFQMSSVRRLLDDHQAGIDHACRIWALLMFEIWHRTYVDSSVSPPPSGPSAWPVGAQA